MPRQRKSVDQHIADGTYRPSRHGPRPNSVVSGLSARSAVSGTAGATGELPSPGQPKKPADLAGEAGELWDRLVEQLGDALKPEDASQLALACRWFATWRAADASLRTATPGTLEHSRLITAAGTASKNWDRAAAKFGLTPADRARMPAPQGPPVARVPVRPKSKIDLAGPPKPTT